MRQKKVIKRGRALVLKLGDQEVEYDPRFKLYLQTKLRCGSEMLLEGNMARTCLQSIHCAL